MMPYIYKSVMYIVMYWPYAWHFIKNFIMMHHLCCVIKEFDTKSYSSNSEITIMHVASNILTNAKQSMAIRMRARTNLFASSFCTTSRNSIVFKSYKIGRY